MKIPLKRAYFVFWTRDPNEGTDECVWGNIDTMWGYLGTFALSRDVTGVFTTAAEAQREQIRQVTKGMKVKRNG